MNARGRLRAAAEALVDYLDAARRLRTELAASHLRREAAGPVLTVLDAGCGTGPLTLRLARRHPRWRITGVDFDEEAVELARRKADEHAALGASFQRLDMVTANGESRFDAVAAIECLSEIADDDAAIGFMAESLRPGGLLLVHVPDRSWRPVLRSSSPVWKAERRHGYSREEIAEKVAAAGLDVASVRPTTHAVVHLVSELRHQLKDRSLKRQLLLYPVSVAAVASERIGFRPGDNRAWLLTARRPS